MSRLIFQKDYIIVLPSYDFVENHRHMMQHIFISRQGCTLEMSDKQICGNVIFLDANVEHKMNMTHHETIFLLLDNTSILADQVKSLFLEKQCFATIEMNIDMKEQLEEKEDEELINYVERLLISLGIRGENCQSKERRIAELLQQIKNDELQYNTVQEIAEDMALSTSRLTHLFKQETGVTLKSYLLLNKLEQAYKYVLAGESITEAAIDAGFSDSAHLAAVCRQLTGISLSAVIK